MDGTRGLVEDEWVGATDKDAGSAPGSAVVWSAGDSDNASSAWDSLLGAHLGGAEFVEVELVDMSDWLAANSS